MEHAKHPGTRLEWGYTEIETLRELVDDLKIAIDNAPCLVSHPGELTYECDATRPCRVCEWRSDVHKTLFKSRYIADI